jgi:hypothetical protein
LKLQRVQLQPQLLIVARHTRARIETRSMRLLIQAAKVARQARAGW